jgi:peptide chain release factor 1
MTHKNPEPVFSATKKDFKIDWFSGQGAGGQHRNKHQNCCRITHIPSGLTAIGQEHRTRPANQRIAFERLVAILIKHYELEKTQKRGERNDETIRTYHEPRNVVKDHASGFQEEYKTVVKDGEIAAMLEARKRELMKKE